MAPLAPSVGTVAAPADPAMSVIAVCSKLAMNPPAM
jgi:hypothetical protein